MRDLRRTFSVIYSIKIFKLKTEKATHYEMPASWTQHEFEYEIIGS